jgi:hypothetical protein
LEYLSSDIVKRGRSHENLFVAGLRRFVPQRRHSDWFDSFDHHLHRIELAFCRLVLFGLALFGLYKLVAVETGVSFLKSPASEVFKPQPSSSATESPPVGTSPSRP